MEDGLRPILLEDFTIEWPGYVLRRVALNQHLPRVDRLGEHSHGFRQALLYLRGEGVQHLGARKIEVARGTLVLVPSDQVHRFEKRRHRRPVCLAIDFECGEDSRRGNPHRTLSATELLEVERLVVELHEAERRSGKSSPAAVALVLRLFAIVLEAGGGAGERLSGPIASAVRRALGRIGLEHASPGALAADLHLSLDHLNRQLRREAGLTVGGLVREARVEKARDLLRRSTMAVGEVGSAIGIDDPNYFARWFRQQCGESPSRWRRAIRGN